MEYDREFEINTKGKMSESILLVENLKKNYGRVQALKGISFDIKKGEVLGLLGPNGAGKSTFFSILATILRPSEGDIILNGFSIREKKEEVRKIIGYVPQDLALYPTLSGLDNLKFWADIYGIAGKVKKDLIDQVILDMDLKDVISRKIKTYSGGMKRRLNIAIGILHNPQMLIMDEPLVGVDVISKRKILDMMLRLKEKGTSIIFSSHSIDEMEKICDRIVLLANGSVQAVGTLDELLKKYSAASLEGVLLGL